MDNKIISTRIIKSLHLNLFSISLTTVDITLDVLKNVTEVKGHQNIFVFCLFSPLGGV